MPGKIKLFCAVLACRLLVGSGLAGEGENLILNPGLENPDPAHPSAAQDFKIFKGERADKRAAWAEAGRTGKMGIRGEVNGEYSVITIPVRSAGLDTNAYYRFSFWYRTESAEPICDAVAAYTGEGTIEFHYPTSPEWTEGSLICRGRDALKGIQIYLNGFRRGRPEYQVGPDGKPALDGKGQKMLLNSVRLTAGLDDFELRPLASNDFSGNLLVNGAFETGPAPHPVPGWWHVFGSGTNRLDTHDVHSGKQALLLETGADYDTIYSNPLPLRAGEIYAVSLWLKSSIPATPIVLKVCVRDPTDYMWERRVLAGAEWKRYDFFIEMPTKGRMFYRGDVFPAYFIIRHDSPQKGCCIRVDDARFSMETL